MQHATIAETTALPHWATLKIVSDETKKLVSLRDFEDLQSCLDRSSSRGLILYDSPVTTVAQLLEQGTSAPDALAQWCAGAMMVLGVLRSNRRKLVLSERPGGDETLQSLSAFFPKITPVDLSVSEISAASAARQLAEVLLTLDRTASNMWFELQASSVGHHSADIEPLRSIGGLTENWYKLHLSNKGLQRDQEEIGTALQAQVLQLEGSLKTTERARILAVESNETQASRISELLNQLQTAASQQSDVRQELLAVQKDRENQAKMLEHLRVELDVSTKNTEEVRAQCDTQALKLGELSKDLQAAQVQSEFLSEKLDAEVQRSKLSEQKLAVARQTEEHLVTQVRELEAGFKAKIGENEHHIQELRDQLDAVYASNSWRITAPIRAVVMWWRGQS